MSAPGSFLCYGSSVTHYLVVWCTLCMVARIRIIELLDGILRNYIFQPCIAHSSRLKAWKIQEKVTLYKDLRWTAKTNVSQFKDLLTDLNICINHC